MSSINNNNQKNQVDTTDLEFGSFNEEEDQFINKKQLVHIEDDTSINVDVSEDDRSKSSSLKKSFLINNISALNEQFPNNNQLNNKKNENYNENEINDLTNSADFYNSQNVLGDIPESNEERIKNENINNDEVIQSLETKIDNNGFFFSRKSKEILENNINNNYKNLVNNKKINLKNTNNDNLSIKDIDNEEVEEEEEDKDINNNKNNIRTSQMMVKKKLTPNEIINKYINNQNINNYNEEFLQNNLNSNGNKYPNLNSNDFNTDSLQQENFYFNIINTQTKLSGSVNTSEQTFGLIQSREFQNKYAQLEARYNSLLAQNKNLEANYQELKNSNKSVLDLLTYWQKFYLEILEIVKPKNENKNNDNSISDYMDDPYRIQVINEVKKIVLIARDKAYNKFYISSPIRFDIKRIEKNIDNKKSKEIINNINNFLSMKQIESFYVKGNFNKIEEKNINNEENNNSSSSIKHKEKINTGTNTEANNEKVSNIKNKYDKKKLKISSKVQNISYINKLQKKIKSNNSNEKEMNEIKIKFNKLKINSNININYKGNSQKNQKKFKKNIMHKIAIIQTDMTCKNINSLETLNKACSSQLLNAQKEKEKMQKLYEEKITSLNNYINENIKQAKKEKENKSKNKEKEKIKEEELIKEKEQKEKELKEKEETVPNLNSSFIFLPEMIPPENTYKIFMHCVKHFKYEEDIYKKYLEEEDLYTLRAFVEKMEKYLTLSLLKNKKAKKENKYKERKDKNNIIINNDKYDNYDNEDINEENISQKKQKDNNMNITKPKYSNAKSKLPNNSENKISNIYNNSNTFNKYKAAIMALKD